MQYIAKAALALLLISLSPAMADDGAGLSVAAAPNGIPFPADYRDWRVVSISHRIDNKSMRVIFGNDAAIAAARAGETNPWPDGATLGKVVWKEMAEARWPTAIAPAKFVHAEFMFKDSERWAENDGWGYARWVGERLEPYGYEGFERECIGCHLPVKDLDYVFTTPAPLPAAR